MPDVFVATPAPSRLNHVSIVKVCAQSPDVESPTKVPAPSFIPQRPIRPAVGEINSLFIVAWIADCARAMFQMRASSRVPAKNPAATPVEFSAEPKAACWMLSERGVGLPVTASVLSRTPSR